MIVTNKQTGKDITRLMIRYMEGKLIKEEFEKLTGVKNYKTW